MIDSEVERLRRLRGVALRVRAVARALAASKAGADDELFELGRCVAWRVARIVTGRLRAHPYAPFTRDANLGMILRNGAIAKLIVWSAANRAEALQKLEAQLRALARELDDVRALTWAADLSDTFGRSQVEIRRLFGVLQGSAAAKPAIGVTALAGPVAATVVEPFTAAAARTVREADWPFLVI